MNAAELEIEWPLFPCALGASISPGAGGEADPPLCPPGAAVPFRGLGAQSFAAPCSGHCCGVREVERSGDGLGWDVINGMKFNNLTI